MRRWFRHNKTFNVVGECVGASSVLGWQRKGVIWSLMVLWFPPLGGGWAQHGGSVQDTEVGFGRTIRGEAGGAAAVSRPDEGPPCASVTSAHFSVQLYAAISSTPSRNPPAFPNLTPHVPPYNSPPWARPKAVRSARALLNPWERGRRRAGGGAPPAGPRGPARREPPHPARAPARLMAAPAGAEGSREGTPGVCGAEGRAEACC